jgi:ABC-type uncharacterized transport system permease subunit
MFRSKLLLAWLVFMPACGCLVPVWAQTTPTQQKQPKAKKNTASLTGCIDQEGDHYILISDRTRAAIANLEADGFPVESFAKHVGQKVTVRGTSNPGTDRPIFRVRAIETVSETCEPQALE